MASVTLSSPPWPAPPQRTVMEIAQAGATQAEAARVVASTNANELNQRGENIVIMG